jgi:hypothetical protein
MIIRHFTALLQITMPSLPSLSAAATHEVDVLDDIADIDWIYGIYICSALNRFGADDMAVELVRAGE